MESYCEESNLYKDFVFDEESYHDWIVYRSCPIDLDKYLLGGIIGLVVQ